MPAPPINERRALIWAAVVIAALWVGHYLLAMRPAASPQAQLRALESERREIAAQAHMRRAADQALAIELGGLDRDTAAALADAEATARDLDRARLEAIAERERRLRTQLAIEQKSRP